MHGRRKSCSLTSVFDRPDALAIIGHAQSLDPRRFLAALPGRVESPHRRPARDRRDAGIGAAAAVVQRRVPALAPVLVAPPGL